MSETQDSGTAESSTTHSKETTLVAYLKVPEGTPKEDAMQWLDHSTDYTDTVVRETVDRFITVGDETVGCPKDVYQLLSGMSFNSVELHKETDEHETEENGSYEFRRSFSSELDIEWPNVLMGQWEKKRWSKKWNDDMGHTKVKVNNQGPKSLGMLKHQSEATPDDRWEDENGVYWAMYYTVEINDVTKDTMDQLSDGLVADLMTALGRHPWVDTVRVRDCEVTETKDGACYDIDGM